MKPPLKLNGTMKITNFVQQNDAAAKHYVDIYNEAVKLGFQFIHDVMIIPTEDNQTPEQKAFLKKLITP
jgi:hypothetical protein